MFESGVGVAAVVSLALVEVRRAANMWVLSVREASSGPRKSLEAPTLAAPRSFFRPEAPSQSLPPPIPPRPVCYDLYTRCSNPHPDLDRNPNPNPNRPALRPLCSLR